MIINNAKVYRNGHFESASIEFDSHIRSFSPGEGMDACGAYIIPGLIDVHTHGAMGIDASDCTAEQIHHLAQFYSDNGVTSFCFTTLTVPADALNGQHTVNLIIFRLMDTDGNLISGPGELHLDF